MNIEWKGDFTNSITADKVTYDIKIFYTEQMKLVHNETIELKANQMGHYNWSWTSPLPLNCTSHSVQVRYRDHDHTSAWTPLKTLPGSDTLNQTETKVYPQNHVALVSEGIRFCCVLKPKHDEQFTSPSFTIRISNRTYVTEPIRHPSPSPQDGFDITCGKGVGSTYYIGYAPDDHNITCETRDLSSVECHWIAGQQQNLSKLVTPTEYTINGRQCDPPICVLNETIDKGVMNWTLTVRSRLGTKIIFDTADPKHRVHLKAATLASTALCNATVATLEWEWKGLLKYHSFPMICQVEVNEVNGPIIKKSFKGTGLTSVVLADLQPFTKYEARVRCGSREHFYKWGDWSNRIIFVTKEDIPEAVDVWMHVSGEETYVVWKNLSKAQSHGDITGYELVLESYTDKSKEYVTKSPAELCHKLRTDSAKTPHVISISAKNSVGVSRPSTITIPNLSPGGGVNISDIKGNNGAFHMAWDLSPRPRCGYVLDWYPAYKAQQCAVEWMKVPPGVSRANISADFKDGVKYTLSVYGCTSEAPYLLQRREGYVGELPPSGQVQNLRVEQEGLNVYLSWKNVLEQQQQGFIKGYNVSYSRVGGETFNSFVIQDPSIQKHTISLPDVASYTFRVMAFTSAGDGPVSEIALSMYPQVGLVIINLVSGLAIMIFVLCLIVVLAYRNKKWLKSVLWPEVPKPTLSEEFLQKNAYQCQVMDQLLREENDMLKVKSPEFCPAQTVLDLQKGHHQALHLNTSYAKDSLQSERYQRTSHNPPTPIPVDLSYKQLPCPGIHNPTYSIALLPAADNDLVTGYMPQT
ncbi:LIF receptor subunit alpha b isoform X2 [Neoarius graeffei]|nr:LIF receptor subunit alpha b isoform X2 [Neoarius graeffei]